MRELTHDELDAVGGGFLNIAVAGNFDIIAQGVVNVQLGVANTGPILAGGGGGPATLTQTHSAVLTQVLVATATAS